MIISEAQNKMSDALAHFKTELSQIRTGRAAPTLVSEISVEVYNSRMMVKVLAQISAPEPSVVLVTPWDKSIITNIVNGITKANTGLQPVVDGELIRIVIPPLTGEKREELIKGMHQSLEKYKVQIRQIRHEYLEELKREKADSSLSEDDEKRREEEIQKVHDEFIDAIEVAGKAKEEELRQV